MRRQHPVEVKILYEDDYLIAINKPSGLLSVATDREKDTTAYRLVKDYPPPRQGHLRHLDFRQRQGDPRGHAIPLERGGN